jgi:hypothetical protein
VTNFPACLPYIDSYYSDRIGSHYYVRLEIVYRGVGVIPSEYVLSFRIRYYDVLVPVLSFFVQNSSGALLFRVENATRKRYTISFVEECHV